MNLEVRKVRAQGLGAPSHEEQRQSLDLGQGRIIGSKPHRVFCVFKGLEVGRTSSQLQKLGSDESQGMEETHGITTRWAWEIDRWKHVT
jgi:hypothetical protein